jgi:5-methyltetrahydrofolate--homocysteine methyltransferase
MRKEPTEAEQGLWQALRRRGVEGMRFRRQRVIGPYIVDFCCLEQRVIVEVDGAHHLAGDVAAYDAERTRYLAAYGLRVVRFGNQEVMNDLDRVLNEIRAVGSLPPGRAPEREPPGASS